MKTDKTIHRNWYILHRIYDISGQTRKSSENICSPPTKKLDDGYMRRNHTGYLYATAHRPSAFMNQLDHGIRSDLLPKASARPRLDPRSERSEAANSPRTSLAKVFELVATGRLVWREGGGILCSKYDFFDAAAKSVESREAGGFNSRRRQR